jgi:4-amino-4-deoxy-L-arabinose transferase-like glycosyltransferase
MQVGDDKRRRLPALLGPLVLVAGALFFGFALDRYPTHYIDEAFFVFAAVKAAAGGSFTYPVSSQEPYGNIVWALHGPLMPHLSYYLFRIFGFSLLASRLPNFLGAWIAALLLVLFLNRRGYRYAGLFLAVLWCGDRALQEVMYARMDGLALLTLVLGFLALERAWKTRKLSFAFLTGLALGAACLFQPFCLLFAGVTLLWIVWLVRWRAMLAYLAGVLVSVPCLFWMWDFKVHDALTQFRWHARRFTGESVLVSVARLYHVLKWSRYWQVALMLFSIGCVLLTLVHLVRRRGVLEGWWFEFAVSASFVVAGARAIFHSGTRPYYIVYFSLWAMLCLVILAEKEWRRVRFLVFAMLAVWCTSAAWNLMRGREPIVYHHALGKSFELTMLRQRVPLSASIVTTPDTFAIPIEDGYARYDVTPWFAEQQDTCPTCYLLLTEDDYNQANYVRRSNLQQRTILYDGPAFPGAGQLAFPIVLLSPEQTPSQP